MHYLLIAFAACLVAGSAQAASFDCKKARSAEEKMICGDSILSRLDEQVAAAYAVQLKAWGGAIAPYVRDDQRAWVSLRKILPPGMDGGPESPMCNEGPEARQCLSDTHNYRLGVLTSGGYRLSGVYERGNDFLRIIPWDDGLDLAFNAGDVSGYGYEDKHTAVPPGATTVIFPIEDDIMTCSLTVSFTADAAVVKQDGQCGGADLRGRWVRNLSRQPAAELF